ncbi:DUF6879 family protein [Streptomyces sp. NPDC049555]|uniref:DUF6879 family protein n=1 Tax=Streptomyces sp. NPDC049555 TaxID=3154930 RepID=UPI0034138FE1
MKPNVVPSFSELLTSAKHSAVHLEMRDTYAVEQEKQQFEAWRAGYRLNPDDRASWWRPWLDLVQATVERGVVMRRARVVSEPVTDYIKYEHSCTFTNIAAGELVRWLPRRQAFDLALPATDFWLIDDRLVRFNHFSGDGVDTEPQVSDDPDVVKLCSTAFESIWERAIPHEQYHV